MEELQEFEEEPSILKKVLLIIASIIVVSLLLFYFLVSPQAKNVLYGFIESSKLENQTLQIDKITKIIFNNESLTVLNNLYDQNLDKEFKVCLKGTKTNNIYYIQETIQPKTFLQEFNRVISEPCSKDFLVSLHTHPLKHCLPSQIDIKNFQNFKRKNSDALLAIMCEKDRFNIYI
ncbi:hypothetical protein CL618_03445 [archaeon]|nr:hypothetical protein [archaeon]|tara:strand:- start:4699 stop:5226 length:528 start_codon:yes stop_codon:yes gene_type:complete